MAAPLWPAVSDAQSVVIQANETQLRGCTMNRVARGALFVVAFLLSLLGAGRARQSVGAFALEQMEHVFDVVENLLHLA